MRGLILAILLALGPKTGGSFGGGNFRAGSSGSSGSTASGGGGGGSGFSVSGGGYHYDSGSSYTSSSTTYHSSAHDAEYIFIFFFVIASVIVAVAVKHVVDMKRGPESARAGKAHLSTISLGIDWRGRKALQAKLAELAQTSDTRSPHGLAEALRETVIALKRAEISWMYASVEAGRWLSMDAAEGAFNGAVSTARARYDVDVVRDGVTQAAPKVEARPEQGEGTVVVTVIVASRRPLAGCDDVHDARRIAGAVMDRAALSGGTLVAFEVVWTPAVDGDRMSTADLERVFPELVKIDPTSIAGRIVCAYCSGPYPAELIKCPHCGAAAPG